jgi:hypothetical protein
VNVSKIDSPKLKLRTEGFRHDEDVDPLVEQLRAVGIPAWTEASNSCSHDEEGHYHATQIVIRGITAKDARKLLR